MTLDALYEAARAIAAPDGRVAIPIIDQNGERVGIARRTPEELFTVEGYSDRRGVLWLPPTAWAYAAAVERNTDPEDTGAMLS